MKGITVIFKGGDQSQIDNIHVKADSFDEFENKLEEEFRQAFLKNNYELNYFNFMVIDSDFVRDYDAEITIYCKDMDGSDYKPRYSYQVDFFVLNQSI